MLQPRTVAALHVLRVPGVPIAKDAQVLARDLALVERHVARLIAADDDVVLLNRPLLGRDLIAANDQNGTIQILFSHGDETPRYTGKCRCNDVNLIIHGLRGAPLTGMTTAGDSRADPQTGIREDRGGQWCRSAG